MANMENWAGRRVLVTGAASGMGRATALKAAALGAEVIALDRNEAALSALVSEASPASVIPVVCDLADSEDVASTFARIGSLDAAVNAAAIGQEYMPLEQNDLATIDRLININFRAVVLCLQAELPLLRARGGGAIVNISSGGGLRGAAGVSVYCATKHAVLGLTKSVAAEVAAEGIRINAVCPGLTDTPMLRATIEAPGADPAMAGQMLRGVPMARLAQPEEIADAIIWLIGDHASYMTGSVVSVDGGVTAI